jgi:hypothetical protein
MASHHDSGCECQACEVAARVVENAAGLEWPQRVWVAAEKVDRGSRIGAVWTVPDSEIESRRSEFQGLFAVTPYVLLSGEQDRYREALERIASCDSRAAGDVVDIARVALKGDDASSPPIWFEPVASVGSKEADQKEAVTYEPLGDVYWVRVKGLGETAWRRHPVSLAEAEELADAFGVPLVEARRPEEQLGEVLSEQANAIAREDT